MYSRTLFIRLYKLVYVFIIYTCSFIHIHTYSPKVLYFFTLILWKFYALVDGSSSRYFQTDIFSNWILWRVYIYNTLDFLNSITTLFIFHTIYFSYYSFRDIWISHFILCFISNIMTHGIMKALVDTYSVGHGKYLCHWSSPLLRNYIRRSTSTRRDLFQDKSSETSACVISV